jgi:hypothetical protein
MRNATRVAASALGVYAGLVGALHGYHEILQGDVATDGLMISAIGPPCQAEEVGHACFPAMTLVPNFLVTGILAVVVGLIAAAWAAGFVQRRYGGLVLMLLSVLLLLVGGGFIPMFVGLMAGFAGTKINAPPAWRRTRFLARWWPWPLVAYFVWVLPVQWFLGRFFDALWINAGMLFFFCFDIGLPLLTVLTGFAHANLAKVQ